MTIHVICAKIQAREPLLAESAFIDLFAFLVSNWSTICWVTCKASVKVFKGHFMTFAFMKPELKIKKLYKRILEEIFWIDILLFCL